MSEAKDKERETLRYQKIIYTEIVGYLNFFHFFYFYSYQF